MITKDDFASADTLIIVNAIQDGSAEAEECLYRAISRQFRYFAIRKVGPAQADECLHDTFIVLVKKLRQGALRDPNALWQYARTILKRKMLDVQMERRRWSDSTTFDDVAYSFADAAPSPEQSYYQVARNNVMQQALCRLRPREREILVRFYLEEQAPDLICRSMQLTHTQFRLLKSRSKSRLAGFTRSCLQRRIPPVEAQLAGAES